MLDRASARRTCIFERGESIEPRRAGNSLSLSLSLTQSFVLGSPVWERFLFVGTPEAVVRHFCLGLELRQLCHGEHCVAVVNEFRCCGSMVFLGFPGGLRMPLQSDFQKGRAVVQLGDRFYFGLASRCRVRNV